MTGQGKSAEHLGATARAYRSEAEMLRKATVGERHRAGLLARIYRLERLASDLERAAQRAGEMSA